MPVKLIKPAPLMTLKEKIEHASEQSKAELSRAKSKVQKGKKK